MPSLPGDPNAAQLAVADQKHAAVEAAVDRLVGLACAVEPGTAGWLGFAYGAVVDAVVELPGDDTEAAAVALVAAAVLRLARTEAIRG